MDGVVKINVKTKSTINGNESLVQYEERNNIGDHLSVVFHMFGISRGDAAQREIECVFFNCEIASFVYTIKSCLKGSVSLKQTFFYRKNCKEHYRHPAFVQLR